MQEWSDRRQYRGRKKEYPEVNGKRMQKREKQDIVCGQYGGALIKCEMCVKSNENNIINTQTIGLSMNDV